MKQSVQFIPTHPGVGLISVVIGFARRLEAEGYSVLIFNPVKFCDISEIADGLVTSCTTPITFEYAEQCLSEGNLDLLLENITEQFENCLELADVIIIKGVLPRKNPEVAARLNQEIAKSLGCNVIFVTTPPSNNIKDLQELIDISIQNYGGNNNKNILGCIVNQLGKPSREGISQFNIDNSLKKETTLLGKIFPTVTISNITAKQVKKLKAFNTDFKLIAAIDWDISLLAPRVLDVVKILGAKVIAEGNLNSNRVKSVKIFARTVNNIIDVLKPGTLVITAADRIDILLSVCYAVVSGINIPAILLTGNYPVAQQILEFCEPAVRAGLNILSMPQDSFDTALMLQGIRIPPPADDKERLEYTKNFIAEFIDNDWIKDFIAQDFKRKMTPPAFKYQIIEKAKAAKKTIVLPEGTEPRIIKAANICAMRNIATCVLLGCEEEIAQIAAKQDIKLHKNLQIIDPETIIDKYIQPLVDIRKNKGMTDILARESLKDNTVLATMMLQMGDVDGLVSGAVNTTANTVRPALQIIKTNKTSKLVSSVFFMCLPDQVLIFGDCAINPHPTAEELADIAIQSAHTAKEFGIEPLVAMISYSTGVSGFGVDVDKVKNATEIVKQREPDLLVDGPLQYDTALIESVANKKAPQSKVAGKATVVIFPDLNTGNTTYKAVQRSANVLSIGPMLQGLNKPVNDLSRGALVDDIVYTIAITAIQAR